LAENTSVGDAREELLAVRNEFQEFVLKYKADLDQKTTYDLISSHGREEELLYYATLVQDYDFVLAYWVQREQWSKSLAVLKRQTDPRIFYKYSGVQMSHTPEEFVDVLMRQANLDANKLIPALLSYSKDCHAPPSQVGTPLPSCRRRYGLGAS
jgi:hypothetical protein